MFTEAGEGRLFSTFYCTVHEPHQDDRQKTMPTNLPRTLKVGSIMTLAWRASIFKVLAYSNRKWIQPIKHIKGISELVEARLRFPRLSKGD